ncbi:hybrid sensor histidine kinase/response regulator [Methanogenium organophilum]|uniref:Response regulator n=1 Tax=Methanogenium organophilum TaxID=2199 RepID=A0A9X9S580_METOG|nr:response regulator [Methanogenium organophilum]WAI02149.1 response regulator [Methanogenium organophilum]
METVPVYRILVVDEEPEVLAVARLFLERDKEIVADTATSPACALAKMDVTPYDVVVSDYMMPDMDGIAFLREVRSRFGDIPFIIMTAYSREEVAIDALNSGADGYLQKGGDIKGTFVELIHLIKNVAGKRDAEQALAESEGRFNDIVENAHDLMYSVRTDGSFILVNRAWRETLGYSKQESASMTVFDVIAPDALDAYMKMFSDLLHGAGQDGFETVFLTKDGRRIPVRGNISCRMAGSIPVSGWGIFHALSGPVEIETDVHTMLAAIRNLPLPIMFTDRNGVITRTNYRAQELFHQACSSLSGVDVRLLFTDPASWDRIMSTLSGSGMWQGEALMQTANEDGGCVLSLCCAVACGSDGMPGVYSVVFPGYSPSAGPDCDFLE